MISNVEKIEKGGKILAIVLRSRASERKLEFFSPNEFPLQFGLHHRNKGEYVSAHGHRSFEKIENLPVQEVLFVDKGIISVGLYFEKSLFKEVIVRSGEAILLNTGHHIRFLVDTTMTEVKQGPYREKQYEKFPLE